MLIKGIMQLENTFCAHYCDNKPCSKVYKHLQRLEQISPKQSRSDLVRTEYFFSLYLNEMCNKIGS